MGSKAAQCGQDGPGTRKRKGPSQPDSDYTSLTGRDLKRAKLREARTIAAQPSGAAYQNGELGLESFINARQFEIGALERSLRQSKATRASRAFQLVPRSMRRRTASHNVKRVPKRLRAKARHEQEADKTPMVEARTRRPRTTRAMLRAQTAKKLGILAKRKLKRKLKDAVDRNAAVGGGDQPGRTKPAIPSRLPRPKIRRNALNDPQKPKSKFRKRQLDKTWLPTHLWHAKRARMTEPKAPLWRFAIPLTPSEKCYRPTHRASGDGGAVVWDTSYMSTIGLYGSEAGVSRVLKSLGVVQESLWTLQGCKWRSGLRSHEGLLSRDRKDGRRVIGPATILWNPAAAMDATEGTPSSKFQRQAIIRVHPACFLELFTELQKLVKMQTPRPYIEDLRFEVGSIELIGPGSTETLLGILRPFSSDAVPEDGHGSFFRSLVGVTNPSSLPANALLGFSVQDPRLAYPPRTADGPSSFDKTEQHAVLESLARWPTDDKPQPFALFDRNARFQASQLPSMKSIYRRKGNNLPGQELRATATDPPIPILLLASRVAGAGQSQGTWTLLAPWKCILPMWYSLVHYPLSTGGNPRFGGLDEARQVVFEHGQQWFPGDYPGTDAGAQWEIEQRAKRKQEWDRRPKGKKVAWESLDLGAGRKGDIGSGFACDFEHLLGLGTDETAQADPSSAKQQPLKNVIRLSRDAFRSLAVPGSEERPLPKSIVTVKISLISRGVCSSPARIYRLPSAKISEAKSSAVEVPCTEPRRIGDPDKLPKDLRQQWIATMSRDTASRDQPRLMPANAGEETRKALLAKSLLEKPLPSRKGAMFPDSDVKLSARSNGTDALARQASASPTNISGHPLCPNEEDLIGFVTTGSFSLSEGKAVAIGSISAEKAVDMVRAGGAKAEAKLCIVRNAGENVAWLARWLVI